MTDLNASVVRRVARAVALTPAVFALAATPAFADTPEKWVDSDPVSAMHALLILVVIPLSLFVIITLLVYVPSMARGDKYTPGQAWRNESEWFGGPRAGIEAADREQAPAVEAGSDTARGGASGRW